MTRAAKICSIPECAQLQPCSVHAKKPWAGSRRRERTMSGSRQQRRAQAVMRLHDGICHVCGHPGSDEVDHVVSLAEGGADTMDNLRPIHAVPCHVVKTAAEAARARSAG